MSSKVFLEVRIGGVEKGTVVIRQNFFFRGGAHTSMCHALF